MAHLETYCRQIFKRSLPVMALVITAVCTPAGQESEEQLVARAEGIHDRVITIDTHDDINPNNFTAD